jgi:2-amino-4-hydroxy-6-hydroxymethyldihydropteridine diphosphokinase
VQPNFVNAVAGFLTSLDASSLLATLKSIEVAQGRERGAELWASRTLDLDLLAHGQTRSATPELTLPHAGIVGRNFVLYPLAEIAPDLILPGLGRVRELRDALPPTGLTRLD